MKKFLINCLILLFISIGLFITSQPYSFGCLMPGSTCKLNSDCSKDGSRVCHSGTDGKCHCKAKPKPKISVDDDVDIENTEANYDTDSNGSKGIID